MKYIDDRTIAPIADGELADNKYTVIYGCPILVDFERSVLDEEDTIKHLGESVISRKQYRGLSRFIKNLLSPAKQTTRNNVDEMLRELPRDARVLVIAGGSIGQGMSPLYDSPGIRVFSFDLYVSPTVQFVADAHDIPLADNQFDAVVVQAVLEHVLDPQRVVNEIWRVLKPEGLVYAETPFMQQVHEGAYDFTRFSESGHRYLFRQFDLVRSGASGGPGLQFMWSADYLARSLFRSRIAGKAAKLAFFWTQYLDRFIMEEYALDAASGVYFMGRKSESELSPAEIIAHYRGAQ